MSSGIPISSGATGVTYPDYDTLVNTEGAGWSAVAIFEDLLVLVHGVYPTQKAARNAAAAMRKKYGSQPEWSDEPRLLTVRVRPIVTPEKVRSISKREKRTR